MFCRVTFDEHDQAQTQIRDWLRIHGGKAHIFWPSNEADAKKAVVRLSDDTVECTFTGSRNGKVGEPIHLECPCATVTFLRKLLFEMLADMKQIWHREYMYKYFYEK